MVSRGRSLPNVRYFVAICAVGILLCSCGLTTNSLERAKQNVKQFHSQLDSGRYTAAYAACDEKFHEATTESDFTKLLEAVHRKLGNVQQANLRKTGVAWFR